MIEDPGRPAADLQDLGGADRDFHPGMPPEVMVRDIMSRLERWTGQSVGIDHQETEAMP